MCILIVKHFSFLYLGMCVHLKHCYTSIYSLSLENMYNCSRFIGLGCQHYLSRLLLGVCTFARGSLVLVVADKATSQRLLINISHKLVLVPHQIIIVSEIGTSRWAFGLGYYLRRLLDGLGTRGGAGLTSGDSPWVYSQEERREEQGGGRWHG